MGTPSEIGSLAASLFGKTRRAVLSLLYGHPDETFYVRQIARVAEVGLGAVQRELMNLSDGGIIIRSVRGRQVYYQANPQCPIFSELRSLLLKTAGMADVLRAAFAPFAGRIATAFIYGSVARGGERRASDVDVLIVGDVTFAEAVSAMSPAQTAIGREINPTVYSPREFRSKLAKDNHFLKTVSREAKVFLIGDRRELARLAQKRLAD